MCYAYCFGLNPSWKNKTFPNKTFCPNWQSLTQWQLKHCQRTKINKTELSASPSLIFPTKFTISELKSTYVFHSNGNWPRHAVSESSARISKCDAPNDSEHRFNKTKIENWLSTHRIQSGIILIGNPQS